MALKLIEGFDDGLTMSKGWYGTFGNQPPGFTGGRFGGTCMQEGYVAGAAYTFSPALTATAVLGFAAMPGQVNVTRAIVVFGLAQLNVVGGGALQLVRSDNGTQIAISAGTVWASSNVWRFLELKYAPTTGAVTVRVDGVVSMTGTLPVQTNITTLTFPNQPNNYWTNIDDVYVLDSTGTLNNDFLGDVRVQTLLPTSDGTYRQLTTSTGTNHSALVQEATPNTTDYVYASTAGQKDTYHFQALSGNTANVFGVEIENYAHKDAVGIAGLSNMVRIGGADYTSTSQSLSSSWTPNRDILDANPATSAAWAASDVNNAEFGVQTT